MTYIFISLFLASVILLIIILKSPNSRLSEKTKQQSYIVEKKQLKPCPICGSLLSKNEKVKSHEYRGESSSIVHIFGCPHCFGSNAHLTRKCPICKQLISEEGYLMGTMTRGKKKIQMKVSGCTSCVGK